MTCKHDYQMQEQTYALLGGKWQPSTLQWLCLSCWDGGFRSMAAAFSTDNVPRESKMVRDDREKMKADQAQERAT